MSEQAQVYHLSDVGDARHRSVERMLESLLEELGETLDGRPDKAVLVLYWKSADGIRLTDVRAAGVNYLEAQGLLAEGANALRAEAED